MRIDIGIDKHDFFNNSNNDVTVTIGNVKVASKAMLAEYHDGVVTVVTFNDKVEIQGKVRNFIAPELEQPKDVSVIVNVEQRIQKFFARQNEIERRMNYVEKSIEDTVNKVMDAKLKDWHRPGGMHDRPQVW